MSVPLIASDFPLCSRRQHLLSQEARDVLAWAFERGLSTHDDGHLPMTAAAVRLGDDDLDAILYDTGFMRYADGDPLQYFQHTDDERWALVFAHDCDGNAVTGERIVESYMSAVDGPPG